MYTFNYGLLYLGPALIGIGKGLQDVLVGSVITLWFGTSKWLSFAFIVIMQTMDIGTFLCDLLYTNYI